MIEQKGETMVRSILLLLFAGWIFSGCAPKVAPEITAQPELPAKPKLDKNIPYFKLAKEHYKAYLQTEDRTMLEQALEEIDAAHTLNPDDLKVQQFYSAIALTKIALDKDRVLADKVIPFFPALHAARLNVAPPSYIEALFADRERERDKIADLMVRAISENPQFAPSYQMLADLYLDQKAYNAAIETLKRGLKVDPNNVTLHLMLATTYLYKTLDLESKNLCGVKNNVLNKKILSEAKKVIGFLNREMGTQLSEDSGIGIKPISIHGTKRLVRKAIRYAIEQERDSVTLMHKGNIMKYTEGAFKDWGYEVAREEFGDRTLSEAELWERFGGRRPKGKVLIKDRIADSMFQQVLLRPEEYSVIATPNLNGDFLSDAVAAQVGGIGMASGANIGDWIGLFEATHGTAPKYAGQDKVNPGSLILSGVMMLEYMGWFEAAEQILRGLEETIAQKSVTYDLKRQMRGATLVKCSEFGAAIAENMRAG